VKQQYLLFPRGGKVWYYKLADETHYHTTGIPYTGKRSRAAADAWVFTRMKKPVQEDPFLRDFAAGFFLWPDAPFIARQLAKGRSFSRAYAADCRRYLDQHILPKWGRLRLSQLTRPAIETWLIGLPLANQTRMHILYAFRVVLREAVDEKVLQASPLERVESLGRTSRERDVFSVAELRILFPQGSLESVWGNQRTGLLFLILATTGIRSGEARALSWRQVLWTERALLVDRTVEGGSAGQGVIGPISSKKGGAKIELLPSRTLAELTAWRDLSMWKEPEDLIFPGSGRGTPLAAATVTHALPRAIERLAREAKEKQLPPPIVVGNRNLVAHSFRHTFTTVFRRNMPKPGLLPKLLGHHSEETTDIYDHPSIEALIQELEPARAAVEGFLS
jgi:integrase